MDSLLKAIRQGNVKEVRSVLGDGLVPPSMGNDMVLAMGMACFLGHGAIVRELASRGFPVNVPDNSAPVSPLSMALRGNHKDIVRLLIEMGAELPDGMRTGLSEQEIKAAQWVAFRDGKAVPDSEADASLAGEVEEIEIARPSHIDTQVLEADALRAVMGGNK